MVNQQLNSVPASTTTMKNPILWKKNQALWIWVINTSQKYAWYTHGSTNTPLEALKNGVPWRSITGNFSECRGSRGLLFILRGLVVVLGGWLLTPRGLQLIARGLMVPPKGLLLILGGLLLILGWVLFILGRLLLILGGLFLMFGGLLLVLDAC